MLFRKSRERFDLEAEIGETTDVSGLPPDIVEELSNHLDLASAELGDDPDRPVVTGVDCGAPEFP